MNNIDTTGGGEEAVTLSLSSLATMLAEARAAGGRDAPTKPKRARAQHRKIPRTETPFTSEEIQAMNLLFLQGMNTGQVRREMSRLGFEVPYSHASVILRLKLSGYTIVRTLLATAVHKESPDQFNELTLAQIKTLVEMPDAEIMQIVAWASSDFNTTGIEHSYAHQHFRGKLKRSGYILGFRIVPLET